MISLVIPLHNESRFFDTLIKDIKEALGEQQDELEIVVVDDGSKDDTWEAVRQADIGAIRLKGVRFSRNFGKEAAIYAGLSEANGNPVIVMDGDGQHPPSLLPEMLRKWQSGALVVEAVKSRRPLEPLWKKICTAFFYFIFRYATGLDLRASTDFKLLDRRVVDAYLELPERNRFFRGLTKWFNFPSAAILFEPAQRTTGETSWSLRHLVSFAWNSIVSFSVWPLRMLMAGGLAGIGASLLLLLQTLYCKFSGRAEPGFSTVIILQLLLGSAILFGLGVVGEYISKIYEEVKMRPLYVVLERFEKQAR